MSASDSTPLTAEQLAAMEAVATKAAAGPWGISLPGGPAGPFYSIVNGQGRVIAAQIPMKADAEFLIRSRTDVPRLLKALDATSKIAIGLAKALEEMEAYVDRADAEVVRLHADNARLIAFLRAGEWDDGSLYSACRQCGRLKEGGHADDCALAAVLAGAPTGDDSD